jgi:hypothetical protein
MSATYTGSAAGIVLTNPVVVSVPADGDLDNAAILNTGTKKLADYIAAVAAALPPTPGAFMSATNAVGQTIAVSPTIVLVVFGTVEVDTASGYNAGTGRYTIPVTGHYQIGAQIASTGTANSWVAYIYKNAAAVRQSHDGVTNTGARINATLSLTAADVIDIRVKHSDTGSTQALNGVALENWFSVKKLT